MVPNHTRYQLRYASVPFYYIFKSFFSQTFLTQINLYYFLFNAIIIYKSILAGIALTVKLWGGREMTIHHDKLAYGKLEASSKELSEEEIAEMLKNLREEEEEEDCKKDCNPPE